MVLGRADSGLCGYCYSMGSVKVPIPERHKNIMVTLKFIADTKKHGQKFTIQPSWEAILNMLLIHGLPKKERKIFDFCRKESRTSREVAQRFSITIYHASTTLKKLHDLTMLSRQEVKNSEGKSYYWKSNF